MPNGVIEQLGEYMIVEVDDDGLPVRFKPSDRLLIRGVRGCR